MTQRRHDQPEPERTVRVTARLDPSTRALAQRAARAVGLSQSAYFARAIRAQAERDMSLEPSGPGSPPAPAEGPP